MANGVYPGTRGYRPKQPHHRQPNHQGGTPAAGAKQPGTLKTIGKIQYSEAHQGWFLQVRQHSATITLLNQLTHSAPGTRHLKTESKASLSESRATGTSTFITLSAFFIPSQPTTAIHRVMDHAATLRETGVGKLAARDEETRRSLIQVHQARQQASAHQRQQAAQATLEQANGIQLPGGVQDTNGSPAAAGGPPEKSDSASYSVTPIPSHHPDIQILTGQTVSTARQAVALRVQATRHPQSDTHLYNGFSNDGLYDLIMDQPGAAYIKGTKGGRNGQGARAGYFKVPITVSSPRLLKALTERYGLKAEPTCPTLDNQPVLEVIRSRLERLAQTYRISRVNDLASQPDQAGQPLVIPKPDGLDYLPYQKAGIYFAVHQGNALIADEPGLGKTIQAIGTSNAVPEAKRILVIAPASLKINWQREWQKWCTKGLRVDRVSGGKPENWPRPTDDAGQPLPLEVVVMNFDLVEQHHARLTEQPWDILIVDEAHALKNRDAKRTKAIFGHGSGRNHTPGIQARRTLLLTGTPILNRPVELYTLAHALDPDFFSDAYAYERRYCNGKKTDYGWDARGSSNLRELQRELRSRIMVRRQKSQVLKDLPPKTRQLIELDHPAFARANGHFAKLEHSAQTIKDCFAKRDALSARIDATPTTDTDALARYAEQVRQLEREARVAFFQMSEVRKETALMKVPQVMDLIKTTLDNGKLILFCHHAEVVEAYTDALNQHFRKQAGKRGKPKTIATVTGKTPNDQRQLEADRFQEDPDCQVFIGTIQAAGTGLTLTSASSVLFAELDWVPGNMNQAEDRAHRIGQRDHVLIYHAVVEGTLDALMVRRLIEKQAVIDSALDDQVQAPEQLRMSMDDRLADWLLELAEADNDAASPNRPIHLLNDRHEPQHITNGNPTP